MPNHITNRMHVYGDDAAELFEAIKSTDEKGGVNHIDFNKIISMPPSLEVDAGSKSFLAQEIHNEVIKTKRPTAEIVLERVDEISKRFCGGGASLEVYFKNLQEYGYTDWFGWARDNWGTKWNAYQQSRDGDCIEFQTAWATPAPVMKQLSKMFPKLKITIDFADEDLGSNCGKYTLKGGEIIEEWLPDGDEALVWACELNGFDPEEIRKERAE